MTSAPAPDLLRRLCPAFAAAALLACGALAEGGVYHVSPSGSNTNPGTEALPWPTIQIRPGERPTGLTVDHNLADNAYVLEPGWWTIASPGFVDLAGQDFRLKADSAAIDTGASAGAPLFDLDGNVRPQGADFDTGAYEYVPVPEPATLGLLACGALALTRRRLP